MNYLCHISDEAPNKYGSPFLLVTPNDIVFDNSYTGGDNFLGRSLRKYGNYYLVSLKSYAGQTYEQLGQGPLTDLTYRFIIDAKRGHLDAVKAAGNIPLDTLHSAHIKMAAIMGRVGVVDFLLSRDNAPDAFIWACHGGSVETVMAIELKFPTCVETVDEAFMVDISRRGDMALFKYLLHHHRVKVDTEILIEDVRNERAERIICEKIGIKGRYRPDLTHGFTSGL